MNKTSQTIKLYELLSSGRPIRTDEIVEKIYSGGSLARVGARINDLKNGRWAQKIRCEFWPGWKDKDNKKLYWYHMKIEQENPIIVSHYPDRTEITEYITRGEALKRYPNARLPDMAKVALINSMPAFKEKAEVKINSLF